MTSAQRAYVVPPGRDAARGVLWFSGVPKNGSEGFRSKPGEELPHSFPGDARPHSTRTRRYILLPAFLRDGEILIPEREIGVFFRAAATISAFSCIGRACPMSIMTPSIPNSL